MQTELTIEGVRHFLTTASKQFEKAGVLLNRVRFNRDEKGNLIGVLLDYEQSTDEQKENEHQSN